MTATLDAIRFVGSGLNRPECVLAHESGLLIAPDWTDSGGVALIAPDGRTTRVLARQGQPGVPAELRPNGIALEPGGTVLLAHLGAKTGGVFRLHPDGRVDPVATGIDGDPMPPTNFVMRDSRGRLWITVSTTSVPRALDYRPGAASGFIALHDSQGIRVVADGLGYTNECLLSGDETRLFVNETFGQRLSVFDVTADGLANRRTLARFGSGTFPDGMAEAEDGSIFVTSIVSNRVIRVDPDGRRETLFEDVDPVHLEAAIRAFEAGKMGRPHLDTVASRHLRNISNIAFGGVELRTAFLGCLLGESIAAFEAPVAGRELPHWRADIAPLLRLAGMQP